jgi:hypothetical protein
MFSSAAAVRKRRATRALGRCSRARTERWPRSPSARRRSAAPRRNGEEPSSAARRLHHERACRLTSSSPRSTERAVERSGVQPPRRARRLHVSYGLARPRRARIPADRRLGRTARLRRPRPLPGVAPAGRAGAVGVARAAPEYATDYARERKPRPPDPQPPRRRPRTWLADRGVTPVRRRQSTRAEDAGLLGCTRRRLPPMPPCESPRGPGARRAGSRDHPVDARRQLSSKSLKGRLKSSGRHTSRGPRSRQSRG